MPSKNSGFTLIEILVAISIISILFGVMISSALAIQRRGRDAKRHSDLRSIQSALQQHYSDQFYYPDTLGNSISSGTKIYLNQVPSDPRSGNPGYFYEAYPSGCDNTNTKCTDYCLYAKLESENTRCDSSTPPKTCSSSSACGKTGNYSLEVTRP